MPRHGYRVERRETDRVLYSSASCDPSELPASFTDRQWYEIWTDGDGKRVPMLPDGMLTSPYDGDVRMPADAYDTGYRVKVWPLVKAGMGRA